MNNLQTLSTERIRLLVKETEMTLIDLKHELDRREEAKQEIEIAHLENHMQSAELSLKTIREFLAFLTNSNDKK